MSRNPSRVTTADPVPGGFMRHQIGHMLRRAYVRARRNSAEALLVLGNVSPVQASALAALMGGKLSQAELGRRIDMEPANTHTLIRRLAGAGLVEISADPDNSRLRMIALSQDGEALSTRLEAVLAGAAATTLAPLNDAEQRQLLALLARIALAERQEVGTDNRAENSPPALPTMQAIHAAVQTNEEPE